MASERCYSVAGCSYKPTHTFYCEHQLANFANNEILQQQHSRTTLKMKIITIIIYLSKNVRFANNDKMNANEIQEKFSNFMKNKQTN